VLPGKPGFTRVDLINGTVQVGGESVEDEPPYQIHVTILQHLKGHEKPHAAVATLERPSNDWSADFPSEGFAKGACIVVGHEVQLEPHFSAFTWVQYMDIK
jgi:hypothetical protein